MLDVAFFNVVFFVFQLHPEQISVRRSRAADAEDEVAHQGAAEEERPAEGPQLSDRLLPSNPCGVLKVTHYFCVCVCVFQFEGLPTYPDVSRMWEIVDKYHVTKFYTAPTAIRLLMKYGSEPVQK